MNPIKCTKIQDIAGCRAILPTVADVRELTDIYINQERKLPHDFERIYNYIDNPKPDGYRGIHLVYKYRSSSKNEYDGMRVELQLRSEYQHIWATAVETVDTFSLSPMKFGFGDPEWKRFFLLMSGIIAYVEKTELPKIRMAKEKDILQEICELADKLEVKQSFIEYGTAVKRVHNITSKALFFVLTFYRKEKEYEEQGFREYVEAFDRYQTIEAKQDPNINTVLVTASDAEELIRAYPNYYIDTVAFLGMLEYVYKKYSSKDK